MTAKTGWLLSCLALTLLVLSCGKDTPLAPGGGLPADTTGADTSRVDTTSLKTPYLIPLAPGASWKYSVHYLREYYRDIKLGSEEHFGTYSLEVTAADTLQKSFEVQVRVKLDSVVVYSVQMGEWQTVVGDTAYTLFAGVDALPVNPDTMYSLKIVTRNDTAFYDFKSGLQYFMPWNVAGLGYVRIDLQLLAYPWGQNLEYAAEVIRGVAESRQPSHGLSGLVSYGNIQGTVTSSSGGVTDFTDFYAPGVISYHTEEYLTYKLLEYHPGAIPE